MDLSYDLVVLSHLRWDFVFQRPQHLLSRFRRGRVFFFEEPICDSEIPRLEVGPGKGNVTVVTPHLPEGLSETEEAAALSGLLGSLLQTYQISKYVAWYYTPAALTFTRQLQPLLSVYDCMDQLSHFKGADPRLSSQEQELFRRVDLVFTGGVSLFEDKREQHPAVYPFPSSVDVAHFSKARDSQSDPADQAGIPGPRVGYFGVIDERINLNLLDEVAYMRPNVSFILVGPTCKIEESDLPRRSNLHYLGPKSYEQLPVYLSGWQVAMMPFALNEATRFISPTKTPEYLAGGRPVVSTSIQDVIRPYQTLQLVQIADTPLDFAQSIDRALFQDPVERMRRADAYLAKLSWDNTWSQMQQLIEAQLATRLLLEHSKEITHV